MITISKTGNWGKAAAILGVAPLRLKVAINRAVLQEAEFFRKKVVEGIREQAPGGKKFKPLSETTLAIRRFRGFRGTKALTVTGDLRNSIKVTRKPTPLGMEAFVGVHRMAKGRNGKPLVNVARIQEFGAGPFIVPLTPAMRRFLFAALKDSGLSNPSSGEKASGNVSRFLIIKIPPRPFIGPVAEKYFSGPDAALRFQRRVASNLGGILGMVAGASISASSKLKK